MNKSQKAKFFPVGEISLLCYNKYPK